MNGRYSGLIFALVGCAVAFATASEAAAQSRELVTRSLALDRYRPPPVQRTGLLAVETAAVLGHATPSARLSLDGADDPLEIVRRRGSREQVVELVDRRFEADLGFGLGLYDRLELGLSQSVVYQSGRALLDAQGGTAELPNWTFGDMRVVPRLQLVEPGGLGTVGAAVSAHVTVPVGDAESYNSSNAVAVQPRAVADWRPLRGVLVAANVGWAVRARRAVLDRGSGDALTWGLGVEFPTGIWRVDWVGNVFGEAPVEIPEDANAVSYAEGLAGLRAELSDRLGVQFAAGSGLTSAIGSPEARVVLSVEYASVALDSDEDSVVDQGDRCPERAEDFDGFRDGDGCPDPDNDRDGVPDTEDDCPDEAEDPDGHADGDGCPDPDNDGDGIPDPEDACPLESGIDKKEGCPFVDADGDGIDDAVDSNPHAAEDLDGFQDGDGAPDPDNDGDGIPDVKDDCPNEPETVNGVEDQDGCPDEGESSVRVTEGTIEIDERVYFDTDRATIEQRSYRVLEEVAAALKAHPEVELVRIEGHTDAKGKDLYNLALSQRRARAVREFLIDRGVKEDRLVSKGYGESEPVATNETEAGRRENRRVEMTILKQEE